MVESKVKSMENIKWKPSGYKSSGYKIYNEKVRWNSESRIKSIIYAEGFETSRQQNVFNVSWMLWAFMESFEF